MTKKTIQTMPAAPIRLIQNMRYQELTVEFQIQAQVGRANADTTPATGNGLDLFRFKVPFQQMQAIHVVPAPENQLVLLMTLEKPPKFFKKIDGDHAHDEQTRTWYENDTWYRQTDMARAPSKLKSSPVTLRKLKPILDFGM